MRDFVGAVNAMESQTMYFVVFLIIVASLMLSGAFNTVNQFFTRGRKKQPK